MSKKYLNDKNLLKNIKSKYIKIFIFSCLYEERKLEIIKFNKALQNIMDVKLVNYKIYKGKHIIYELNGKAKEYNAYFENLEFEGEYLN